MLLPLDLIITSWRAFPLLIAIIDLLIFVLLGWRSIRLALLVLMRRVPLRLVTQKTPLGERALITEYFQWYFAGLASATALAFVAFVDPEIAFRAGWQTMGVFAPFLLGLLGSFGFFTTVTKLGSQIFPLVQEHLYGAPGMGVLPGATFGVVDDEWVGVKFPEQPKSAGNKQQAMALFQRAKECVESNNLHTGINLLQKAIRLWPENAELHDELALCYSRSGVHDRAIEESEWAVRLNPQVARFYTNPGLHLLRRDNRDDLQRVEECAVNALAIDPTFSSAHKLRSTLNQRRRNRI